MKISIDEFICKTRSSLIKRVAKLESPALPDDLLFFCDSYEAGSFQINESTFNLINNPFIYNSNIFHAVHESLPRGAEAGGFRRYDHCYVLAVGVSPVSPHEEDPERLYISVELSPQNFGWICFYGTGEHPWEITDNSTYVADSWSGFMRMVVNGSFEFQGAPIWDKKNRVMYDADLADYYVITLPPMA